MNKAARNLKIVLIVACLVVGVGLFAAHGVSAQNLTTADTGIATVGTNLGLPATDIRLVIARIIRAVLGFLGIVAVLIILYGGFQYMTAGGNEEKVSDAKKILINGVIGLVIVLSAFSIASFVVSKLVGATTGVEQGTVGGGGGGGSSNFLTNVFYVDSLPQAGALCIRNVHLLIVFSKDVDLSSLIGNIVVQDVASSSAEVAGNWAYGTTKNMAIFTPAGSCAPSAGNDCFKPEADYNLVFKNAAGVKTLDKNPELTLDCQYKAGCGTVSFKTGLGVDRLPPTVSITYPTSNSLLQPGTEIPVQLHYSDDNGVQNLALSYAKGTSSSTLISSLSLSGCTQIADVTMQWPTSGIAPATYTLSAVATDWSGQQGAASQDVTLRPAHCFNNVQDADESGIDCGGSSCGACQGSSCTIDADCASGSCVNGICLDVMRIDSFSPTSGAPGTFVSIFGRYFGTTPGKVYFATTNNPSVNNPADWKQAPVVNCGNAIDNWSDRQILVEVPVATAASSPIKVEAAPIIQNGVTTTPTDVTSNHNLPNFAVTTLVRPGICVLNPNQGQSGDLIAISGKNFGTLQSASDNVSFGDLKATIAQDQNGAVAWSDQLITATVPALTGGTVGVTVTKDGVPSNSVRFALIGGVNATDPFISTITPTQATAGDYITITGGNFGDTIGSVWFKATPTSPAIIGSFNFPSACQSNVWTDKKIIVKFPSGSGTVGTTYLVQINTSNNRVSPIDMNETFALESGQPSPGICSITPVSGPIPFPTGQTVKLSGENFLILPPGGTTGPLPTDVYFWSGGGNNPLAVTGRPLADSSALDYSITTTTITVRPPDAAVTGPVSVYRGTDQKISNPVDFTAADCRVAANQCVSGSHCCYSGDQAGMCKPNAELCVGEARSAGYVWRFSTKDLPPVPHVVERCDATTESGAALPTPTPSIQWDANNQGDQHNVCASALAVVEFSTAIDPATINDQNIVVNRCTSVDSKNNCVNPVPQTLAQGSYTVQIAAGAGDHSYIELKNSAPWDKGIWYQIVLKNKISSDATIASTDGVSLPLAADKPCGTTDSAYCFVFQGGGQPCALRAVLVTPYNYLTQILEAPIRRRTVQGTGAPVDYVGNGLSSQRCIMMDVSGYNWQWASADAKYADIYNTSTGRVVNVSAKGNTVGIGLPDNSVAIQATATTDTPSGSLTKEGQSPLTIDLTNPEVVDHWPDCLEACTDADVAVEFNVSLSTRNIDTNAIERGVVKLNKCNDDNCLSVTQVGVSSDVILDPQPPFNILHIANSTNSSSELEPNQLYQVVISAVSSDPAATDQVWSRAFLDQPDSSSKPYNKVFTWRFRTKAQKCVTNRVAVTPLEFTAQFISDRAVYSAQPFSSPDACSAAGQKLNPWKVDWSWGSSDPAVATVSAFSTKGQSSFCTASCVKKGSTFPSAGSIWPVCGNGKVEAGEDCDPPGKANGCGLDCRFLGNSNVGTGANQCGNGVVEHNVGEACDPADPATKIGCSANCLNLGSLQAAAIGTATTTSICGSGTVGSGEDCDIGIAPNISLSTSAMGCSATCLHLGTHISSQWCVANQETLGGFGSIASSTCAKAYSQCGDGVPSPDEDPGCDLGGGKHATWCNDYCLVNSKDHPSSVGCTANTEGCGANGEYLGSSLTYSIPSVCGDTTSGIGEDPSCETNLNITHDGLTNPWALASGVGKGVGSGNPPAERTAIAATTAPSKSGSGQFIIACGYKTDADCVAAQGNNYGLAADSCCYPRPKLVPPTVPVDKISDPVDGSAVCINTAIQAKFDQPIDPASVQDNFVIARGIGASDSCASSTDDVTALIASALPTEGAHSWLRDIFDWALAALRNLFGDRVFAKIFTPPAKWCVGNDLGTATVVAGPNATSLINFSLVKPLASSTNYAVILKPGIKNTDGISIGQTAAGKDISWEFDTRSGPPCYVDSVTVDPAQSYFSRAGATTTLTAYAHSGSGSGALIQPLPGFYSWNYIWQPTNNASVAVPVSQADNVLITSENTNGEVTIRSSAHLIDNIFTDATGTIASGTAHAVVFLCANPWPTSAMLPYRDTSGNNDAFDFSTGLFPGTAIPPSTVHAPGVGDGYYNFSTYYCADSGGPSTFDDLPYLHPAVQTTDADLAQGQWGNCEYTGTSCQIDSDCGTYYQSIFSFAAPSSATYICGGTTSTIATPLYYLDSAGAPVVCQSGTDTSCTANQDYLGWKTRSGITTGSTCLPLNVLPSQALSCYRYPPLKRFLFTNNNNSDGIGIQVFSNPHHLTPTQWYAQDKRSGGQGFQGAVQSTKVDGWDAVSDGNNVYIGALDYSTSTKSLYALIYLLSINSDAQSETRQVFDAFVKNFHLDTNLTANDGYCGDTIDTPDYTLRCHSDLDCPSGKVCADQIDKLRRDYQRIRDLRSIDVALESYAALHPDAITKAKTYPNLKQGTFLTGQTISTWSSWSVLGQALGQTIPIDPVNQLGKAGTCTPIVTPPDTAEAHCSQGGCNQFCTTDADCGTGATCTLHDATTGWSTADRRFSFACATTSYAYRYIVSPPNTTAVAPAYLVRSNIEDIGVPVDNLSGFLKGFRFINPNNYNGLGFNSGGPGICNNDQEVVTISKGTCGDGQVNVANNEQCDPPGTQRFGSCINGSISVDVCSAPQAGGTGGCQWVTSSTPNGLGTVSCSYLSTCGNGLVETGETCDDGAQNGKYNHCNAKCTGKVAAYDPANPTVSPGYCGDGQVNPAYEICDSTSAYWGGSGQPGTPQAIYSTTTVDRTTSCGADCQSYGTYCGDGIVQTANGEECDPAAPLSTLACTDAQGNAGAYTCQSNCKLKTQTLSVQNGALAWWKMDSLTNNQMIDNIGTYTGSCAGGASCPFLDPAGEHDGAYAFSNPYPATTWPTMSVPDDPHFDSSQFSIVGWVKIAGVTAPQKQIIVAKQPYNSGGYGVYVYSNLVDGTRKITFAENNDTSYNSAPVAAQYTWIHIAVTFDGGNALLYMNGSLVDSHYAPTLNNTIKGPFIFGSNFTGWLDDFAYYNKVLTAAEILQRYNNTSPTLPLCTVAPATTVAVAAPGTCGDGVVDPTEACDNGAQNGIACTPSYGKACSYCSADCKNKIDVQPTEYCGDGIIEATEVCDTDANGVVYAAAKTDPATTATNTTTAANGFKVLACSAEPTVGNIFKKGTKICANNCTAILTKETGQASCVTCGIDTDNGVTVKGSILNVLEAADPTAAQNPLYAGSTRFGKIGLSGVLYSEFRSPSGVYTWDPSNPYLSGAKPEAIAGELQGYNFTYVKSWFENTPASEVYTLQIKQPDSAQVASLATNSLCYNGDSDRNYMLSVNNDGSYPFLFPIKSVPDPWQYDFTVSPIISATGLKNQSSASIRPDDIRIVVSWVGNNSFYSGFVKPVSGSPTIESLGFNGLTTGFDYYTKPYNDFKLLSNPSQVVWPIWYHGSAQTAGLLSEESFTINTKDMQENTYAFYVRTPDGSSVKSTGQAAKLRVDIYLPKTLASAPDYATFTQPDRTFQLNLAAPSDNAGASYWEVLKIDKTAAAVGDRIQDVTVGLDNGKIVTGVAQF